MTDDRDNGNVPNPMINYLAELAYDTAKEKLSRERALKEEAEGERLDEVILDTLFSEAEKDIKAKHNPSKDK